MTVRRFLQQDEATQAVIVTALENQLSWHFRKPELLRLALTHRSFTYEAKHGSEATGSGKNLPGEDNEQLEFLGDAVLGLVVTEAMYKEFPERSEGELTRMRASLVSRERMAQLGSTLHLGQALLLGNSAERNGGRRKPALLANAAEAVIAAVYLDAGERGLETAREVIHRLLIAPELPALRSALATENGRGALRDGKTLLQERVQAEGSGRLLYVDISQSGPAHERRFAVEAQFHSQGGVHVLASAEGNSKKEAQQRAAVLALENWTSFTQQTNQDSRGEA